MSHYYPLVVGNVRKLSLPKLSIIGTILDVIAVEERIRKRTSLFLQYRIYPKHSFEIGEFVIRVLPMPFCASFSILFFLSCQTKDCTPDILQSLSPTLLDVPCSKITFLPTARSPFVSSSVISSEPDKQSD